MVNRNTVAVHSGSRAEYRHHQKQSKRSEPVSVILNLWSRDHSFSMEKDCSCAAHIVMKTMPALAQP